MKHLSKWFIATLAGVALFSSSCVDQVKFGDSFLEKAPGVAVTQDTIFGKATYARAFLWNTYSKLYYALPVYWNTVEGKMNTGIFEMMSDCWHTDWNGINRKYYSGSYKAGDEDSSDDTRFGYTKENCWEAIRAALLFVENVERVPDMEDAEKKRLAAEAKVIVASRYFDLFRHFGGLPLIKETYDVQPSYELPRATVEETVNYMINLLDEAAATPQLPWDLGTDDTNWQGRFTKAAAMGLKCKILLFAASPLFNDDEPYCTEPPQDAVTNHQVWYGAYKPELWEQCWQACDDFFKELQAKGYYELTQATEATAKGYRDAYNKAYFTRENNKELLISTHISRFSKFNSWDEWQYIFVNSGNGTVITGGLTPTLEFMEMFPMSKGEPFQLNSTTNPFYTDNDYNKPTRDPRLYETMLVNGTQFGDHAAELWIGGRDNINDTEKETGKYATGFGCYKFYKEGVNSLKDKYLQWPYLRLAEMYLIYAEALLKSKNDLTGAIEQVNKVRARVGLGDLAACNPDKNLTNDANALLEEILRERACELGLEDVRLFDMTRYKRDDLFRKQLHGLKIYRNDGGGNTPWSGSTGNSSTYPKPTQFTYEAFPLVNPSRAWWSNFSPKWYLSAFPPSEVNKKYGLTQNPGWN